jgi:hypothetical protein
MADKPQAPAAPGPAFRSLFEVVMTGMACAAAMLAVVAGCGDDGGLVDSGGLADAGSEVDAGWPDAAPADAGTDAGRCVGADGLPCLTAGGAPASVDCMPTRPVPGVPGPVAIMVRSEFFSLGAGLAVEIFPDGEIADDCSGSCMALTADDSGHATAELGTGWFAYHIPSTGTGGGDAMPSFGYRVVRPGDTTRQTSFITHGEAAIVGDQVGKTVLPGTALLSGFLYDCEERAVAGASVRIYVDGVEVTRGPATTDPFIGYSEGFSLSPDATTTSVFGQYAAFNIPVSGSATARVEVYGTRVHGGPRELVACEVARIFSDGFTTRPLRPLRSDYEPGHGCFGR